MQKSIEKEIFFDAVCSLLSYRVKILFILILCRRFEMPIVRIYCLYSMAFHIFSQSDVIRFSVFVAFALFEG